MQDVLFNKQIEVNTIKLEVFNQTDREKKKLAADLEDLALLNIKISKTKTDILLYEKWDGAERCSYH